MRRPFASFLNLGNLQKALTATVFTLQPVNLAQAEPVSLTLPQAHVIARSALDTGRPRLAYTLSEGLLQADPRNGFAHYVQARALSDLRAYEGARKAAGRAYRFAQTDVQRYESAHLAAKLSFADEHLTMSQFWLRRAVQHAPDDATRDQSVTAYKQVRQRNPLHFNFNFSVTPSDNVNNGSNSPLNIIDGVPVTGLLSSGAQALSGTITRAQFNGSYRISASDTFETRLTGLVSARNVTISEDTPDLSGSDLSSTTAQLGVKHTRKGTKDGAIWSFDLDAGRVWFGGDPLYNFASTGAQRFQNLTDKVKLTFGGELEQQQGLTISDTDTTIGSAFGGLSFILPGGSDLGFRLQYRDADSDGINRTLQQWSGFITYQLGKPIGPAEMSFAVGRSIVDYDEYSVGFISVPGGRDDTSTFGSVTATFQSWSYLGFVPTLSVRSERSRSNVSRFDVDETSISLGIRSEF